MSRFFIFCFLILASLAATAQPVLDKLVNFSVTNQSLEETLYQFSETAEVKLTFSNDILPNKKLTYSFSNATIQQILNSILNFSLELEEGSYELEVSYLGYQRYRQTITLAESQTIKITMRPSLTIEEIIVVADNILVFDPDDYLDKLVSAQLSAMPTLGGEKDIFRLATHLPGVSTGTDGVGGIHVRGGSIDQNLFLLDDVPIYNPTHLLGVFSVFNNDAIKSASFVRGRFPARYGGRLSSVMDIRTKDGNLNEWKTTIGAGLASVKFSTEGPLVKGKSSLFLAARTTPLGLLIKRVTRDNKASKNQEGFTDLSFYDINAKLHYKFSDKNKLYLSFYKGNDRYEDDTTIWYNLPFGEGVLSNRDRSTDDIRWGNTAGALRWNHLINKKVFLNTSLIFSQYNFASKSMPP